MMYYISVDLVECWYCEPTTDKIFELYEFLYQFKNIIVKKRKKGDEIIRLIRLKIKELNKKYPKEPKIEISRGPDEFYIQNIQVEPKVKVRSLTYVTYQKIMKVYE